MTAQDSPATIDDFSDGGDEVQRRFRYQINYCALKALHLLRPTSEFCAIYCEHIEDLLIESLDGTFIGIQIKTRELDRGHFRSNETTIVNALCRFCVRDARFPKWFSAFILATNFVFFKGDGVDDLRNVLACARKDPTLASRGPRDRIRKYLQGLAEHTKLSVEAVIGTLAKLSLEERHTGVDQPDFEIIHALGQIAPFSQLRWHQLLLGVRLLRGRVWDGSSLALEGFVLETHDVTADFAAHLRRLRVARKRIDAGEIAAALNPANTADAAQELLTIAGFLERDVVPPGLGHMELKMAAGAIGYSDIEQMKDDVASLESAFLRWKERIGLTEANRHLAHLQYIAQRDARVAEKSERRADAPYGAAMLYRIRDLALKTWLAEKTSLFGCRPEHLVGTAGLLSEECKISWSGYSPQGPRDGDTA